MRLFRPCFLAEWLYPDALFRIRTKEKLLCLTFDDGPDPGSTPALLEILAGHKIKAIFFCNGKAAEKYPELIREIKSEGHLVGNHGYSHLNGYRTSLNRYVQDVAKAAFYTSSQLFRPPYGRLRYRQYMKLKEFYLIVFWDLMAYDFDNRFGTQNALRILKKRITPGSIIVLHDTPLSKNIELIDEFILFAKGEGYFFDSSIINVTLHR